MNLNDIDPWLWVPIYLSAAICCGSFWTFLSRRLFIADHLLPGLCYYLFFAEDGVRDWIKKYNRPSIVESMQTTKPYIEKTREFFGLLIITGALLINYIAS